MYMPNLLRACVATGLAAILLAPSTAVAQPAVLLAADAVSLAIYDPSNAQLTTLNQPTQRAEGVTWSHDGMIYLSAWTTNGVLKIDPANGAVVATVCADSTNLITGAPYVPVVNNEAVGGPGLWCVDGNPVSPNTRNTALIDVTARTCTVGCTFPTSITPIADCHRHPLKCGTFLGVGWNTADQRVYEFTVDDSGGPCQVTTVCTLPFPTLGNAFVHEDSCLYCYSASASFRGYMKVDLRAGSCSTIALPLATASNAAVWNDPHGYVGRLSWIYHDGANQVYMVDTAQNSVVPIWNNQFRDFFYAREEQANQLTSWVDASNKAKRTFHINFSQSNFSGADRPDRYLLLPSTLPPPGGNSAPASFLVPRGLGQPSIRIESWFVPDALSWLTVTGQLGTIFPHLGSLDAGQEADVVVDTTSLGLATPICVYWIAFAYGPRGAIDVSPIIPVRIH